MPLQNSPKEVIHQQQSHNHHTSPSASTNLTDITMTSSQNPSTSKIGNVYAAFTPVESISSFRALSFWRQNPILWLIQLESMFLSGRITSDSTKFHHTVSSLDADTMAEVKDILRNPPEEGK